MAKLAVCFISFIYCGEFVLLLRQEFCFATQASLKLMMASVSLPSV